jgi:hypothetical protein
MSLYSVWKACVPWVLWIGFAERVGRLRVPDLARAADGLSHYFVIQRFLVYLIMLCA